MYKGASHDKLSRKGSKMPTGKPNTAQDSQAASAFPAREGSNGSPSLSRPKIDLESMLPLQRARLDAAVMMLVDYLVSASAEA